MLAIADLVPFCASLCFTRRLHLTSTGIEYGTCFTVVFFQNCLLNSLELFWIELDSELVSPALTLKRDSPPSSTFGQIRLKT